MTDNIGLWICFRIRTLSADPLDPILDILLGWYNIQGFRGK